MKGQWHPCNDALKRMTVFLTAVPYGELNFNALKVNVREKGKAVAIVPLTFTIECMQVISSPKTE